MAVQLFVTDRDALRQRGWPTVLWGAVMLLFGVAVLAWPELSGTVLVALVGATILAVGLVLAYGAWRLREYAERLWVVSLVPALVVAAFGAVVLAFPDAVGTVLLVVVAALVILAGIGDIASSFALVPLVTWWWIRLLRGALLAGAGVWVVLSDVSGLAAIGVLVGVWAVLLSAITIAFGALALRA